MMDYIKYETKLTYPKKKNFVTFTLLDENSFEKVHEGLGRNEAIEIVGMNSVMCTSLINNAFQSDNNKASITVGGYIIVAWFDKEAYVQKKKEFYDDRNRLMKLFHEDLANDNGVDVDSKLHRLILAYAEEKGESNGFASVAQYYEELAEFAEKVLMVTNNS